MSATFCTPCTSPSSTRRSYRPTVADPEGLFFSYEEYRSDPPDLYNVEMLALLNEDTSQSAHRVQRRGRQGPLSPRLTIPGCGRLRQPQRVAAAVLGEGQLAAWKESLGADTAKWWRGHLRALRQNDAAGAKRADSGWGSVERAAVGAAWRIPIPAQVRGMVVGTLEVEWPPRHDSERAATSGPDTGATAAAASSCAPAPDPTS